MCFSNRPTANLVRAERWVKIWEIPKDFGGSGGQMWFSGSDGDDLQRLLRDLGAWCMTAPYRYTEGQEIPPVLATYSGQGCEVIIIVNITDEQMTLSEDIKFLANKIYDDLLFSVWYCEL